MSDLTMIDLFAGVGGFRYAFEKDHGVDCVFSSEIDKFSRQTYLANWGEDPAGDITQIDSGSIPAHDILCAGFPCQSFSISGVPKLQSLGRQHGFQDPTRGTMFFEVKRIIDHHRPQAFVLENVPNLQSHDKGNTFRVIMDSLVNDLGYDVHYEVLGSRTFVPQDRKRIFIVGFHKPVDFSFPVFSGPDVKLGSILEDNADSRYTLGDGTWAFHKRHAAKHKSRGNGFGFGLFGPDDVGRTLSARYHKDGAEVLICQGANSKPRKMTPRECARYMGYPDDFLLPCSDTQSYRQMGNSVVVPVVSALAKQVLTHL